MSGRHFGNGADAVIRVGKGAETCMKRARFYFEGGELLDFDFLNNEQEFSSQRRGSWRLSNSKGKTLDSGEPAGPNSSELFARDIVELCNGSNLGLTVAEIKRMYQPQWDFQRIAKNKQVVSDAAGLSKFIEDALACRA